MNVTGDAGWVKELKDDHKINVLNLKTYTNPVHFLLCCYRHLEIFFAFYSWDFHKNFLFILFATLNKRTSKHREIKKYREMINLRVGFPRSIVEFLLQVPRINGMKYHIKFFPLFVCCFERTDRGQFSSGSIVWSLSTEVEWNYRIPTIVMQSSENWIKYDDIKKIASA